MIDVEGHLAWLLAEYVQKFSLRFALFLGGGATESNAQNGLQECSIASPKMPQCQGLDRRGDAPIRVHDKLGLEMTKE